MILYDLAIGSNKPRKGDIWTTDGRFISPKEFYLEDSYCTPIPYGYVLLDEGFIVSLKKSSQPMTYKDADNYCNKLINASVTGFLPGPDLLKLLHLSITRGSMIDDLYTAGIGHYCNYRFDEEPFTNKWSYVWARSGHPEYSYSIHSTGSVVRSSKENSYNYVIPFFKI